MKIILSGATGFIGKNLVPALLKQQHEIYIISRNPSQAQKLFGHNIQCYAWNELAALDPNIFSAVINLSGENISQGRWTKSLKTKIIQSRVEATQRWVSWISPVQHKPHLYNASAIGAYGLQIPSIERSNAYTESTNLLNLPSHDFVSTVGRAWETAADRGTANGIAVTKTRFGVVLKANEGMLKKLVPSFKLGLGMILGSGNQALTWVHIDDVVGAILFLLNNPTITGAVNITAPEVITQKTFAQALAKTLHRRLLLTMPKFLVKLLFGEMGKELLLGSQNVYPQRLLELGYQFKYADIDSALKAEYPKTV